MEVTPENASDEFKAQILSISKNEPKVAVFLEGVNAVAYSIETGSIISSNSNHQIAINEALDNLTIGRNYKERIILVGHFSISSELLVSSYTTLEVSGKLTSTLSGFSAILTNKNATNTDIDVIGGLYDVDNIATPFEQTGISFSKVSNLNICNTTVMNSGKHCIDLKGCSEFTVENNHCNNMGDDGISILYSYSGRIINNTIIGGPNNGNGGGSSGIELEDGSHDIVISSNSVSHISDASGSGIHLILDPGGPGPMYNLNVVSNTVRDCGGRGIGCISNKAPIAISAISAIGDGTIIVTAAGHNLTADSTWLVELKNIVDAGLLELNNEFIATTIDADNFSINLIATGTYSSGATVDFDIHNVVIAGNTVDNVSDNGVQVSRSREIAINNNSISRADKFGVSFVVGARLVEINGNIISNSGIMGINAVSGNDKLIIVNNVITNSARKSDNQYGIFLNGVSNTDIFNNVIEDTRPTKLSYGIRSLNGGSNRIVDNNAIDTKTNGGLHIMSTPGDVVRGNVGHKTENSGSSGLISSGGSFAHGLQVEPTSIQVTAKTPGVTGLAVTVDSLNATISFAGGGAIDVYWQGVVEND